MFKYIDQQPTKLQKQKLDLICYRRYSTEFIPTRARVFVPSSSRDSISMTIKRETKKKPKKSSSDTINTPENIYRHNEIQTTQFTDTNNLVSQTILSSHDQSNDTNGTKTNQSITTTPNSRHNQISKIPSSVLVQERKKGKGISRAKTQSPNVVGEVVRKRSDAGVNKDDNGLITKKKKSKRTVYKKVTEDQIRSTGMTSEFRVNSSVKNTRPNLRVVAPTQMIPYQSLYYFYGHGQQHQNNFQQVMPNQLQPQLPLTSTFSSESVSKRTYQYPIQNQIYSYPEFFQTYAQQPMAFSQLGDIPLVQPMQPINLIQTPNSQSESRQGISQVSSSNTSNSNIAVPTETAVQAWNPDCASNQLSSHSNFFQDTGNCREETKSETPTNLVQQINDEESHMIIPTNNPVAEQTIDSQIQIHLSSSEKNESEKSLMSFRNENQNQPQLQFQVVPQDYQQFINGTSNNQQVLIGNEFPELNYHGQATQFKYYQYEAQYLAQNYHQSMIHYPSQIASPASPGHRSTAVQGYISQGPSEYPKIITPVTGLATEQSVSLFGYPTQHPEVISAQESIITSPSSTRPAAPDVTSNHRNVIYQSRYQSGPEIQPMPGVPISGLANVQQVSTQFPDQVQHSSAHYVAPIDMQGEALASGSAVPQLQHQHQVYTYQQVQEQIRPGDSGIRTSVDSISESQ